MRQFTDHKFIVIERVRNEGERFFVQWDGYEETVGFTQNVMYCTKYTKENVMDIILKLDKMYPEEKFALMHLVVDFDIKEIMVW